MLLNPVLGKASCDFVHFRVLDMVIYLKSRVCMIWDLMNQRHTKKQIEFQLIGTHSQYLSQNAYK